MTFGEHREKLSPPSPDDDADSAQRLTAALQQAKRDAGLSFTQLAQRIPYSRVTVWRYIKGESLPPSSAVIHIANACGCDPEPLLRLCHAAATPAAAGPRSGQSSTPVTTGLAAVQGSSTSVPRSGRRRSRSLAAVAAVLVAIVIPSSMAANDAEPSAIALADADAPPDDTDAPANAAIRHDFAPRHIRAPRMPKAAPDGSSRSDHEVVALGSVALAMSAKQTAYVVSVMRAGSATYRSLFDNEVRCRWPGGEQSFVTGQNILQHGTSSEREREDVQLTTRFLLHPGVATKVTCTAYVRAATLRDDLDAQFRLDSGRIGFADTSVDNTTTGVPAQAAVPRGLLHVGPAPHMIAREPVLRSFTFAPGFTHLSISADTQYQTCYPQKDKHCDISGPTTSTATFTLYVTQWKGNEVCQKNRATGEIREMSYAVHHHHVPLHLPNFAIRADCDPRFSAYVMVRWVDGMDGAVQGAAEGLTDSRGSTSQHNANMSHIFAIPYNS
nr:helix-turn-helix transcriptional regulator [Kibdelosporangium sp. MJ126-NF4]CEL13369.1 hypothetical protein [Kibdelosporangium sp. MJ126-NF4]CTQ99059.1 hypothetical protein [Kibdelosporangium sp. MJ126-NF4]